MRTLNLVVQLILVLAGIQLGLLGFFNFDVVGALFGAATETVRVLEIIAGIAALYGFYLIRVVSARATNEPFAQMKFREPAVSFGDADHKGPVRVRVTNLR
jgi:uncharacterized protein